MAIALVQVGAISSAASTSISPTLSGVKAGNLVVAHCISQLSGTSQQQSCSTSGWASAVASFGSGTDAEMWYLPGTSNGGGTITPTITVPTSATNIIAFLSEWSGVVTAGPLESTATASASASTTCASGTLANNANTSVAIATFDEKITTATCVFTPMTNYTNVGNNGSTNIAAHITADYRLNAPTGDSGTETSSVTSATSGWRGCIATFKAAPPPDGGIHVIRQAVNRAIR